MKSIHENLTWSDFPGHCYEPEQVAALPLDAPLSDILADVRFPEVERLWAFLNAPNVPDREKRLFACRCVRETPIGDGRTVWDLLTDPRSRRAVEVAEAFAKGEATEKELRAARAEDAEAWAAWADAEAWAEAAAWAAWAAWAAEAAEAAAEAAAARAWADAAWAEAAAARAKLTAATFQLQLATEIVAQLEEMISGQIRAARIHAGLSQAELAAKIGTHQPNVSDWESGKKTPFPETLEKIAAATGCEFQQARLVVPEGGKR